MTLFYAASAAGSGSIGSSGTFHYLLIVALMMTGIYLVLSRGNMVKTIIGLNLFQVSAIMFYVSMGRVDGGTAPILYKEDVPHHDEHHDGDHGKNTELKDSLLVSGGGDGHSKGTVGKKILSAKDAQDSHDGGHKKETKYWTKSSASGVAYSNPLPHVLMLTAIVVGVATTALALSLVVRINEAFGTIEEDELEEKGVLS